MSVSLPTQSEVEAVVQPLLKLRSDGDGIAIVIGCASPDFETPAFYLFGKDVTTESGDPIDVGTGTPFCMGSNSKTFTATLFARAVELNPQFGDQFLSDYHPVNAPTVGSNFAGIPLVTLVNYTSGLPTDNKSGVPWDFAAGHPNPYTVDDLFTYLSGNPYSPPAAPNVVYQYSNLGFALAGAVVPIAFGWSGWFDALTLEILKPLGITAATLDAMSRDVLPQSYAGDGTPKTSESWPLALEPAGGIVVDGENMMRWLQYNMHIGTTPIDSLLVGTQTPSTTITTKNGTNLGLGWFLNHQDPPMVWKDGEVGGFASFMAFAARADPSSETADAGAFIMTNISSGAVGPICTKIVAMMLGKAIGELEQPEIDAANER